MGKTDTIAQTQCRLAYGPADASNSLSLASVNPDWFYLCDTGSAHPGWEAVHRNVKLSGLQLFGRKGSFTGRKPDNPG